MFFKLKKLIKVMHMIITDYINYTLAKSEVPNMYIVEVGYGNRQKTQFFPIGLKILGQQIKSTKITNT